MADEPDSLWLIPRDVRDKLDRIGVKLHLREWQELSFTQRQHLCDEPCGSADDAARYRDLLRSMLGREPERLMPGASVRGGES